MTAPAAALLQERFREALGAVPPEGLALGAMRSRIYTRLARVHRDLDEVPEAMTNYMQAVQGLHDAERASSVEFADLNLEYARYGSEVAKSPITTMVLPKNQSNKSNQTETKDGITWKKGGEMTNKEKAASAGVGPDLTACTQMVQAAREIYASLGMTEKVAEADSALGRDVLHGVV